MTRACCCSLCSGRSGLFMTGSISLVGCMCVLLPCVYCMVREEGWNMLRDWLNSWLVRNHWDVEVTQSVWRGLDWIDEHYRILLAGLVSAAALHLLSTLLLLLGSMLYKRCLLVPWLITDLIIILSMGLVFTSWTFLSFFVDLLIAIVFPVIAGLVMGFWILLWRNTQFMYSRNLIPEKLARRTTLEPIIKGEYQTVPNDLTPKMQAHKQTHKQTRRLNNQTLKHIS